MKVYCHTNLDLMPSEKWPDELPVAPHVGDEIESAMLWEWERGKFKLHLRVVALRWVYSERECKWILWIELHTRADWSVKDFYEWYAPKVGRRVSSFI